MSDERKTAIEVAEEYAAARDLDRDDLVAILACFIDMTPEFDPADLEKWFECVLAEVEPAARAKRDRGRPIGGTLDWTGYPVKFKADAHWVLGTAVRDPLDKDEHVVIRLDDGRELTVRKARCKRLNRKKEAGEGPPAEVVAAPEVVTLRVTKPEAARVKGLFGTADSGRPGEVVHRFVAPAGEVGVEVAVVRGTPGVGPAYVAIVVRDDEDNVLYEGPPSRDKFLGQHPLVLGGRPAILEIVTK